MGLFKDSAKDEGLKELFLDELKDIYWAEQYLVKNLPEMAEGATSAQLKKAFTTHLEETKEHVSRLEKVFSSINESTATKKCEAMNGLVKEAKELLSDTNKGSMTRDVALISAAQKVEHYEIATYGTLRTLAEVLGYGQAATLLETTLKEEKHADQLLTDIAEGSVNVSASKE